MLGVQDRFSYLVRITRTQGGVAGILIFIMSSQQSDSSSDPEAERWIEQGETLSGSEGEQPTETITTNESSRDPDRSVEGSDRSCSLLDDYALLLSHE